MDQQRISNMFSNHSIGYDKLQSSKYNKPNIIHLSNSNNPFGGCNATSMKSSINPNSCNTFVNEGGWETKLKNFGGDTHNFNNTTSGLNKFNGLTESKPSSSEILKLSKLESYSYSSQNQNNSNFNNNFNKLSYQRGFLNTDNDDKENSSLNSNFINKNNFSDKNINNDNNNNLSNDDKSNFADPNSLGVLRKNLAHKFSNNENNSLSTTSNSNNIFDKTRCSKDSLSKTLISSDCSQEYEDRAPSESQINNTQQTITDSFLEGFSKKNTIKVPREKVNDEKFKLLQIKKVRKEKFKDNKSVSAADLRKDDEVLNNLNYFSFKKRKMVHSVKNRYTSEISFIDPLTSNKKVFRIYKDNESGINEQWQQYLIETTVDEDVESDNDLINNARENNLRRLNEAKEMLNSKQTHMLNNISLLQD